MYKRFIKRFLDFTLSLFGLILLSPFFVLAALLLFMVNRSNPFFMQSRPGKNERTFRILKFKTMNDRKDENGNLLPDMKRITRAGAFIRRMSLDEIPQLINVLKGDMSLIGPRPLLIQYLSLYNETQKRRHEVRPGITGWAQVNGRNAISWQQKLTFDVWYVDHTSFRLDLKILYLTVIKIFTQKDINSDLHTTMQPFTGNN
ncbi:MAG: sugar transferase [Tannerella sp.]|jgi:lipopolysaccharide/colanic/teichoic acid biosynthesis glycosyltransferase|nr:sugar transferase [Tannerella sp.]